jgi:hypothetical protein
MDRGALAMAQEFMDMTSAESLIRRSVVRGRWSRRDALDIIDRKQARPYFETRCKARKPTVMGRAS